MNMVELLFAYKYSLLFVGMFLLGETVLLPALYLTQEGHLNLFMVIVVSALATIVSDFVWYVVAYKAPLHKVGTWHRVKKHQALFEKLSALFDAHAYRVLFVSKFVYGTRILVQLLCGMKKMPFVNYLIINTLGTLLYIALLYCVAYFVGGLIAPHVIGGIKAAIIIFIILVVLVNLFIRYLAEKIWFQS
jgi:membrane protein DedA with SNARE-associated domain